MSARFTLPQPCGTVLWSFVSSHEQDHFFPVAKHSFAIDQLNGLGLINLRFVNERLYACVTAAGVAWIRERQAVQRRDILTSLIQNEFPPESITHESMAFQPQRTYAPRNPIGRW